MSLWGCLPLAAAAVMAAVAIYLFARWRRAPTALRAMGAVAGICFAAGFFAGLWAFRVAEPEVSKLRIDGFPGFAGSAHAGSVSAKEVGRAIVDTDERHAGDPLWLSSARMAEICNKQARMSKALGTPPGLIPLTGDSEDCRVAYLARHAIGEDLDHGPHKTWITLSEVADICDEGKIYKSSHICAQAYAARNAQMNQRH